MPQKAPRTSLGLQCNSQPDTETITLYMCSVLSSFQNTHMHSFPRLLQQAGHMSRAATILDGMAGETEDS